LPDDGIPEPPAQTRDNRRAGGGAPFGGSSAMHAARNLSPSKTFSARCLWT